MLLAADVAVAAATPSSIAGIASAAFLSGSERRNILCDNAARFYRLDANATADDGSGAALVGDSSS